MVQDDSRSSSPSPTMNFDYLYEFSETRKVLEEFFKSGTENQDTQQLQFQVYDKMFILHFTIFTIEQIYICIIYNYIFFIYYNLI